MANQDICPTRKEFPIPVDYDAAMLEYRLKHPIPRERSTPTEPAPSTTALQVRRPSGSYTHKPPRP